MSTTCGRDAQQEARRLSTVIQFLMDTDGMGHFEPSTAYCIAANERGGDASPEVLDRLQRSGLRVLSAGHCTYDESVDSVVVIEDRTPAVLIWARETTGSEMEQFTGQAWETILANASMMRAGFYTGQMGSADYFCLVSNARDPEVIQCDLGSVS